MARLSENERCNLLADWLDGATETELAEKYPVAPGYARVLALRNGYKGKDRKKRTRRVKRSRDWLRVGTLEHKALERKLKKRDWLWK